MDEEFDEDISILSQKIDHIYDGMDRLFDAYQDIMKRIEKIEHDIKCLINGHSGMVKLIEKAH